MKKLNFDLDKEAETCLKISSDIICGPSDLSYKPTKDPLPPITTEPIKIIQEQAELIASLQAEIAEYEREFNKARPVSSEEQICMAQLRILSEKAKHDELDLKEAQKFEIFHKNLRLARGQVLDGDVSKKKPAKKLPTSKLLEIAQELNADDNG